MCIIILQFVSSEQTYYITSDIRTILPGSGGF